MADDRTTVARIRDETLRLFAERGEAAVSLRQIAAAAGVSAPLIVHHFGSKAGLRRAIDNHVATVVAEVLTSLDAHDEQVDTAGFAAMLTDALDSHPHLVEYLRRMVIEGGEPANDLFASLHAATVTGLEHLHIAGMIRGSGDPAFRAAFLLANDLAVMLLREPIRAATGVDPLDGVGIERWTATVMEVYGQGLFTSPSPEQLSNEESMR